MVYQADILVVGAGVMGTSIAWALAEKHMGRIVVLERTALAAEATGQSSGVLRCHYGIPILAMMANQGLEWFKRARRDYGVDVGYRQTGYIVGVGAEDEAAFRANIAMQQGLGIGTRLIDPEEVQKVWPDMNLADLAVMAFEPDSGVADPTLTATAFYELSKNLEVQYYFGQQVNQILTKNGDVWGVRTQDGSEWMAPVVIVAAGADTPVIFQSLEIPVPIRRQRAQLIFINPGVNVAHRPVFSDLVQLQYGRPEMNGTLLVGNSDHRVPEWIDDSPCPHGVTESFVHGLIERVLQRFPTWDNAQFLGGYSGCYEVTPDYNPIIGPTPVPGLFVAAGFSGHGFKLSPVIGPMLADIVSAPEQFPQLDSYVFRLSRFQEGDLLVSQHPYGQASQMR